MPILNAKNLDETLLDEFNLIYIDNSQLTIRRHKRGGEFYFKDKAGKQISNINIIERLNAVAVPPAYKQATYSSLENGHLQAVGIDSNGNKQYFYHVAWEDLRALTKFSALQSFGEKIPAFRRKITKLIKSDDQYERVIAAMFRILDKTGMRVGGESSAKTNKTYGITTLLKKHIDVHDSDIDFDYSAKGGVEISLEIHDTNVSQILEECEDIGGQRLFEYEDDKGNVHSISSQHLNRFLKSIMGDEYSVKDFRTWRFSCLFLKMLLSELKKQNPITLKSLLDKTSEKTGNTPSILQSSYVHPGLIDIAKNHQALEHLLDKKLSKVGLRQNEAIFLNYLKSDHAKQSLIN